MNAWGRLRELMKDKMYRISMGAGGNRWACQIRRLKSEFTDSLFDIVGEGDGSSSNAAVKAAVKDFDGRAKGAKS